jgi:two-component system sensor histidine kinase ChiS
MDRENLSILIVDDEPKNIQLLANLLRDEGYSFEFATDGEGALEWAASRTFQLILLDIMMPDMDGYEVCRALKSKPETRDTPVIFLSAKSDLESIVQGFDVGAVDYLSKPFNKSELLARVSTHLELVSLREGLEKLVRERTAELQTANRELEKFHEAAKHFVPFELLNILGKESVVDVRRGDQIHSDMTIAFSDIRSYTTLSETMTPQEVFDFTNGYHNRMTPLVRADEGFVQQFQGDGAISVFPRKVDDSLRAAIAIQEKVRSYNVERESKDRTPIKVGIGVHSGPLMIGILGDDVRWEPGMASDTVNTAARMEGLTKIYGCSLVISDSAFERLESPEEFTIRLLDKVHVKGKHEPHAVYEVVDAEPKPVRELKLQTLKDFEAALERYFNQEFEAARAQFYKVLVVHPDDLAATLFLQRVMHFIEKGVPNDWTGVMAHETK